MVFGVRQYNNTGRIGMSTMNVITRIARLFCNHQPDIDTMMGDIRRLEAIEKALLAEVTMLLQPKPTVDIPSPKDRIPHDNVIYNQALEKIEILGIKPGIWLTEPADTNSMDPTVDAGHTMILTDNFRVEDLVPGDIVAYEIPGQPSLILHRIVGVETDATGRKWKLKGDNNHYPDPYEVRDENIRWLKVGIIY